MITLVMKTNLTGSPQRTLLLLLTIYNMVEDNAFVQFLTHWLAANNILDTENVVVADGPSNFLYELVVEG